jgi:hypothetical protein
VVADPQVWLTLANGWSTADRFPLLRCPPLLRYRDRLGLSSTSELPGIDLDTRPGVVLSAGSDTTRSVAGLLARATGRPHRHVPPKDVSSAIKELRGEYVAVVLQLPELDEVGDWLGDYGDRVGLVTARSLASLVALVHRGLTLGQLGPGEVRRLIHPALPGAEGADVVSFGELDRLRGQRTGLLLLRSHGRECCLHLPDGIICGRSDAPGVGRREPAPAGTRVPSCMHGEGCYRHDLTADDRAPAYEIAGSVVFAHSCAPVAAGINALPHQVNLSLGFLEGVSVAVIGAIGRHEADHRADDIVATRLSQGERLGDVLATINTLGERDCGELSRFALLGDPALTLPENLCQELDGPAASPNTSGAVPGTSGAGVVLGADPDRLAALRELIADLTPALDVLRWLDFDIDDTDLGRLHRDIRVAWQACASGNRAARRALADSITEFRSRAVGLQRRTVEAYLTTVHTSWWQFGGPSFFGFEPETHTSMACPNCGRSSARRLRFRHRIEPRLQVRSDTCRRCGPLRWQAGRVNDTLHHTVPNQVFAARGETVRISAVITNRGDRPLAGAAGCAFVNGEYDSLPAPVIWPVELSAGESRQLPAEHPLHEPKISADPHEAVFVSCLDGTLTVLPVWLCVEPGEGVDGRD